MTASVLSLTVMSGLKSFHKSRLQSKQRLTKKTERKSGSHNRSRQHVMRCLLVGWFWSNRIWSVGLLWLLSSQPAGQPAQTRPGFLILVTCMGCGICWKGGRHMVLACFYGTIRRNASPLTNVGGLAVFFPLLFSKSWLVSTPVAKHRGNKGKQEERPGDGVDRTGGTV